MKIITTEVLSHVKDARIIRMEILAPHIARKARPGQFVVLMAGEEGERIPLTIVDKNESSGIITLIFQELGLTTKLLGGLKAGDSLYALIGPLGNPTEIKNYGKIIIVGGGVGIAEIYPVTKAMKEAGNHVTVILGARTKDLLILEKELKGVSDEFYVTTDDGSHGEKGFTTGILKRLLDNTLYPTPFTLHPAPYTLVYAVGPIPMMKKAAMVTKEYNVKTLVSLNALMVDATGMCGCCRVSIGGEVKFSCVDGPEFDGHLVNWDELTKRNNVYAEKEKHICNRHR